MIIFFSVGKMWVEWVLWTCCGHDILHLLPLLLPRWFNVRTTGQVATQRLRVALPRIYVSCLLPSLLPWLDIQLTRPELYIYICAPYVLNLIKSINYSCVFYFIYISLKVIPSEETIYRICFSIHKCHSFFSCSVSFPLYIFCLTNIQFINPIHALFKLCELTP